MVDATCVAEAGDGLMLLVLMTLLLPLSSDDIVFGFLVLVVDVVAVVVVVGVVVVEVVVVVMLVVVLIVLDVVDLVVVGLVDKVVETAVSEKHTFTLNHQ